MTSLVALFALPLVFASAVTQSNALPVAHVAHVMPPPPLPALPVIARVHVDVAKDHVLVVHDIVMARGDFSGGDIDLWVSFGPMMPRALDAHLLSVAPGTNAPDAADTGEPIATDKAAHRPPRAHPLLGRSAMAGEVLHLREPAFRRAISASGVLALRIRQILPAPAANETGAREVLVRLGMESATPLTLRHLELSTSEPAGWLTSASAQLCGPNADPYVLGFSALPHGVARTPFSIDPTAATRRTTDDLCVRYVATP